MVFNWEGLNMIFLRISKDTLFRKKGQNFLIHWEVNFISYWHFTDCYSYFSSVILSTVVFLLRRKLASQWIRQSHSHLLPSKVTFDILIHGSTCFFSLFKALLLRYTWKCEDFSNLFYFHLFLEIIQMNIKKLLAKQFRFWMF